MQDIEKIRGSRIESFKVWKHSDLFKAHTQSKTSVIGQEEPWQSLRVNSKVVHAQDRASLKYVGG